jgi:tetratricopeptide (TPR) repeat protein
MSGRRGLGAVLIAVAATAAGAHPGLHHDIAAAGEAIAREPQKADLYVERAFLERLDQEFDAALADLDRAKKLEPSNPRVAAELGMTYSALGRDREADVQLTAFVRHGGTAPAFAERAMVRERLGRLKESIADYGSAIALKPDIEYYLARGTLQESLGDWASAAAGYRDGRAKLGDAVTLDLALIRAETKRGRYAQALELVNTQLAAAPVKTDWYLRRADVLDAAGRSAEAQADRRTALQEADTAVEASGSGMHLYARARAQAALGLIDGARRDLELVLQKSPRFVEAREMLAKLSTTANDKGMKP